MRTLTLSLLAALAGCSEGGRKSLSGSVSVGGMPVSSGIIYLEPDDKKGNLGPQAVADIANGTYRTRPEFGVVRGPHVVRVVVNPDPNDDPGLPKAKGVMAGEYATELDITADMRTADFDLPSRKRR